jgi:hypothetical protein
MVVVVMIVMKVAVAVTVPSMIVPNLTPRAIPVAFEKLLSVVMWTNP